MSDSQSCSIGVSSCSRNDTRLPLSRTGYTTRDGTSRPWRLFPTLATTDSVRQFRPHTAKGNSHTYTCAPILSGLERTLSLSRSISLLVAYRRRKLEGWKTKVTQEIFNGKENRLTGHFGSRGLDVGAIGVGVDLLSKVRQVYGTRDECRPMSWHGVWCRRAGE